VPDIIWSAKVGDPPLALDVKTMYPGGNLYTRYRKEICGAVRARADSVPTTYLDKAKKLDVKYNNTVPSDIGPVQQCITALGDVRAPVVGAFNEISKDFHTLIRLAAEDIAKKRFEVTTLPIESYQELLGPISWDLKQRLGMHLFRSAMAFKFDRLNICLGHSHTSGFVRDQCYLRSSAHPFTTERIIHRFEQVHRQPISTRRW
jgi:hypothetical protein